MDGFSNPLGANPERVGRLVAGPDEAETACPMPSQTWRIPKFSIRYAEDGEEQIEPVQAESHGPGLFARFIRANRARKRNGCACSQRDPRTTNLHSAHSCKSESNTPASSRQLAAAARLLARYLLSPRLRRKTMPWLIFLVVIALLGALGIVVKVNRFLRRSNSSADRREDQLEGIADAIGVSRPVDSMAR